MKKHHPYLGLAAALLTAAGVVTVVGLYGCRGTSSAPEQTKYGNILYQKDQVIPGPEMSPESIPASTSAPAPKPCPMPAAAAAPAGFAPAKKMKQESASRRAGEKSWSGNMMADKLDAEDYKYRADHEFMAVADRPLSTFSVDVDTAAYANLRRFLLRERRLPPVDAVRVEECLNYFAYDYPAPQDDLPLRATMELGVCPWNPGHDLLLIGLQARRVDRDRLPPSNFVFLIDTSGSMTSRMPLVKQAMTMLAGEMRPCDRIAIVTYAGSAGLALPSTSGAEKTRIADRINRLEAGGSTAGAAGIRLAYSVAAEHFIASGNNRVVLITDGDFNVGISSEGELVRMIEKERAKNIFLTVIGVGTGNYKDGKMQMLADKGNGNYIYLDGIREARKALVNEMSGTMYTIAKDVKIQIEFNPRFVKGYRLIGYEKRRLEDRDFTDDTKDAGDVGVGHQVTALYELIPAGSEEKVNGAAPLEFQRTTVISDKLLNFRLRWKDPHGAKSREWVGYCTPEKSVRASSDFRFAAAVAEFGLLLRDSKFKGSANWPEAIALAKSAPRHERDFEGSRHEFIRMAQEAERLQGRRNHGEDRR